MIKLRAIQFDSKRLLSPVTIHKMIRNAGLSMSDIDRHLNVSYSTFARACCVGIPKADLPALKSAIHMAQSDRHVSNK